MKSIKIVLTAFWIAVVLVSAGLAQAGSGRVTSDRHSAASRPCLLSGAYRIDVDESDKLYSVVKDAASTVPFGEQQRFFMDLSTRLTPPDMLAIECDGSRVTIGSSRAARMTYLADGRTRRERTPGGSFVNSRIELKADSLVFVSSGTAEDNVNVAFRSMDNGRRLRVTRQLFAEQLSEPIIIESIYEKIADNVEWDIYDGRNVAARNREASKTASPSVSRPEPDAGGRAAELREAMDSWLAATNQRDIDEQMRFYMPELKAYYLARDAPKSSVKAEKVRVFAGVRSVDIRAREPEIIFQDSGRVAIMRFVKEYRIEQRSRTKSGAVIQELRWQRTGDGWKIFSERDVRVLR